MPTILLSLHPEALELFSCFLAAGGQKEKTEKRWMTWSSDFLRMRTAGVQVVSKKDICALYVASLAFQYFFVSRILDS